MSSLIIKENILLIIWNIVMDVVKDNNVNKKYARIVLLGLI